LAARLSNLSALTPEDQSEQHDAQALAGDRLRTTGLRVTPQRRAILAAFRGGDAEHLSADEVYSRAAASLPDLGRGTVYATLAEFAELGLLTALGTPEPVRYETNMTRHAHFRCRICLRIFDIDGKPQDPEPFASDGHHVELLHLRAEGVCHECGEYERSLEAAVESILASGASAMLMDEEIAVADVETPVGHLLVAATAAGVARVAFPEHGDAERLRGLVGRDAPPAAAAHLQTAADQVSRYFSGGAFSFDCPVDWDRVGHAGDFRAAMDIPYGGARSYHLLNVSDDAADRGSAYGANPIPIISPCHRITRGAVLPGTFSGGEERRVWLLEHERSALSR
jgi:methylated-DNA-[protein]-cysteine S-methyltransferase